MKFAAAIAGLLVGLPLSVAADLSMEEVRGPVVARVACDRTTLPLSGDAFATISVSGPQRVEVVTAPLLLTDDSLQAWHVEAAELPLVEEAKDGRQIWSRRFRLRPYLLGPSVPIAIAPITIRAGTLKEFELAWAKPLEVAVTKTLDKEDTAPETDLAALLAQADANKLKPATGAEQLPKGGGPPKNPREQWLVAALVGVVAVLTLLGAYLVVRRVKPVDHAELHDTGWALQELERLRSQDPPQPDALDRVSYIVREWLELYRRIPISRMTTTETLDALRNAGSSPEELQVLGAILEQCDFGKFVPGCLSNDILPIVDRAVHVVRGNHASMA